VTATLTASESHLDGARPRFVHFFVPLHKHKHKIKFVERHIVCLETRYRGADTVGVGSFDL